MGSSKENVIKEQVGIIKLRLATFIELRKRSIIDITAVEKTIQMAVILLTVFIHCVNTTSLINIF